MTLKSLVDNELYSQSPTTAFTGGLVGSPRQGHVHVHTAGSPAVRERLGSRGRELGTGAGDGCGLPAAGKVTRRLTPDPTDGPAVAPRAGSPRRPHQAPRRLGHPVASAHLPSGC